ncbi:MAG: DUF4105 domain-containing protein [Taibaiella sp.]|nr:DUF4105 domain-containing protein [Taibaiella sp.]
MKRISLFLLLLLLRVAAHAQPVAVDTTSRAVSGLRISLLTCGPGQEEVYEIFGHTGLRVVDSNAQPPYNDLVYNYGMFSYGPDFEMKFMRGKLPYYVASNFFLDFMEEYQEYGRSVEEQVLQVSDSAKHDIKAYLEENCLPQNRYYKYDFFFDNCATRIRDIFPRTLGSSFAFGNTLKSGENLTYRHIINRYFYKRHWERVGVNILLGSKIDRVMSNTDIMFLPDYLRDGLAGATLSGVPVAEKRELLLDGSLRTGAGLNLPLVITVALLLLAIIGTFVPGFAIIGRITGALVLVLSGLLGAIIVTMWFATDHQACANNYNLLWALPTNLVLAFARRRSKDKYAVIAMALILLSALLHFLRVEGVVPELFAFMGALFVTHLGIYRRAKAATK